MHKFTVEVDTHHRVNMKAGKMTTRPFLWTLVGNVAAYASAKLQLYDVHVPGGYVPRWSSVKTHEFAIA